MKVVGLLAYAVALRTPDDLLFRKQAVLDKFRFPNGIRPELPRGMGPKRTVVSPGGKFEFEVGSHEDASKVAQLTSALQVAGGFLENAIAFNATVRVQLDHGRHCSAKGGCGNYNSRKLGYAMPNEKMHYVPRQDLIYTPYALVNHNITTRESTFDMYMQLNPAERFIYPDEYGSHSPTKNADILRIIVHELCHGLGIYSKLTANCAAKDFVGPYMTYLSNKTHITTLFHKSLFDTHLLPKDPVLALPTPATFLLHGMNLDKFTDTIHTLPGINDIKKLYKTPNSTQFLTNSGSLIDIDTETPTPRGSSFSHVAKHYQATTDFLMTHLGIYYSVPLENAAHHWATAPLANATLEMLETIGYSRNPQASRARSQVALYEQMRPFNRRDGDERFKNFHSHPMMTY